MRARTLRSVVVLVALVRLAAPAGATVDATGIFTVTGAPFPTAVSIRQVGSTLTMCAIPGSEIVKVAGGIIDPATGNFALAWTLLGPGGLGAYCSITWTGTFAADGASFTGHGEERSTCVPPPFSCQPQCVVSASYSLSGTRTQTTPAPCCADGVTEAAEQCDDGNTTAGDCCSPTCTFEVAGTTCRGGCDPGQCNGAGMCTSP